MERFTNLALLSQTASTAQSCRAQEREMMEKSWGLLMDQIITLSCALMKTQRLLGGVEINIGEITMISSSSLQMRTISIPQTEKRSNQS